MNNYWPLLLATISGVGLGLFFYGGLYFTVTRGLSSPHPALWFFSSFLLRTSVVLAGLYFISNGQWQRIVAAMAGFMLAGIVIKVWKGMPSAIEKAQHASHQL